jgi:hypothetical protein
MYIIINVIIITKQKMKKIQLLSCILISFNSYGMNSNIDQQNFLLEANEKLQKRIAQNEDFLHRSRDNQKECVRLDNREKGNWIPLDPAVRETVEKENILLTNQIIENKRLIRLKQDEQFYKTN